MEKKSYLGFEYKAEEEEGVCYGSDSRPESWLELESKPQELPAAPRCLSHTASPPFPPSVSGVALAQSLPGKKHLKALSPACPISTGTAPACTSIYFVPQKEIELELCLMVGEGKRNTACRE